MSRNLKQVLSSLRDVDGIVGSFVVNADGELVAQDLPAYFDGVAEQVAPRAVRLRDALSLREGAVSTCTIRYADHKLSMRSVHGALLAVLAKHQVNAPALRMAMNLVARKCSAEELENAAFTLSPPAVAASSPPAPTAPDRPYEIGTPSVSGRPGQPMPPPPSARAAGSVTLPSVAPPAISRAGSEASGTDNVRNAPPDDSAVLRKERAVYFRGKRVN